MQDEPIICPIRFIRKPEESECVRQHCGFWVGGEYFEEEEKGPVRFTAIMTMPRGQEGAEQARQKAGGKCAVLAIAEEMIKAKEHR
jgi:hypothetical protein